MDDSFSAKYTNANKATDAALYDETLFTQWRTKLDQALPGSVVGLSTGILVAMLCAQRRGDAVGPLFAASTALEAERNASQMVIVVREALTVCAGFVGLPNVMPAAFGYIAELKKLGISEVQSTRPSFQEADYIDTGYKNHKQIYRGVGNPEVAAMIQQYIPDLSHFAMTAIFGYALSGHDSLSLRERELIVVASIIALGASRQARSHCKAAIQLGNTPEALQVIDSVAHSLASWNGMSLPERLNVPELQKELMTELAKLTD